LRGFCGRAGVGSAEAAGAAGELAGGRLAAGRGAQILGDHEAGADRLVLAGRQLLLRLVERGERGGGGVRHAGTSEKVGGRARTAVASGASPYRHSRAAPPIPRMG
jgi:hypothetical protein